MAIRVAVIGDVMLDTYIYGNVSRISPEASVPVVDVDRVVHTLGGAANVAVNLRNLGCCVDLIGVVGDDTSAELIGDRLFQEGIINKLTTDYNRKTTTKTRVVGTHQIVRYDVEDTNEVYGHALDRLHGEFNRAIKKADALLISDYSKGVIPSIFSRAIGVINLDIPTFVDPKGTEWDRYKGAMFITPNLKEFTALNTDPNVIMSKCDCRYLLVTKAQDGMTLYSRFTEERTDYAAEVVPVCDVSGAGDTAISTLAFSIAQNLSIDLSVRLANLAAGEVVKKVGTQPITLREYEKLMRKLRENL